MNIRNSKSPENKKIEQARNLLVQLALDEICSEANFPEFHRHAY